MERYGLKIGDFDVIELNEAFASQALACLRQLGLPDDAEHVNPNGGAIALGHPLGMSGARLAMTAAHQMVKQGGKRALATMCVGVGQGVSLAIERVVNCCEHAHALSSVREGRRDAIKSARRRPSFRSIAAMTDARWACHPAN